MAEEKPALREFSTMHGSDLYKVYYDDELVVVDVFRFIDCRSAWRDSIAYDLLPDAVKVKYESHLSK